MGKGISADTYDEKYYTQTYGQEQNIYTLEHRRKVEGRHPELILDTFKPVNILDTGCGKGHLIHFLLNVYGPPYEGQPEIILGLDYSKYAVNNPASSEVAGRLIQHDITKSFPLQKQGYDLVISREVIEHLTVEQTIKYIQNMAEASSKYIYCTARLNMKPDHDEHIITEFSVDPTHITLMPRVMLEKLFQKYAPNFRQNKQLEQKMDWMKKGRVFVYERVQ